MDERERQQSLEDAVRDAVAAHAEQSGPSRPTAAPRREAPLLAFVVLGWIVIGWIWIAKPAVVFGPPAVAESSATVREARLRYAMYLQHHEIARFVRDSGRLPGSLAELALDPADGVRLEFDQQGTWALVGTDRELTLRLSEAMSADSFLGTSLATLQGRD